MTAQLFESNIENITRAAHDLKQGKLVAFPTETVYGLGADATNDKAVASIFEAKGRPSFNPIIVHYLSRDAMDDAVIFNEQADMLATLFWPGPLTLILPRREQSPLSLLTSAGLPTQAVRCPAHPVARKLIKALNKPIAAPSANASGTLSPTTAEHVLKSLGDKIGMILTGGKLAVGVESTVLDMTGDVPVVLRHGGITVEELKFHIGDIKVETEALNDSPKSPGQLLKHYAPKTPLRLKAVDVRPNEALLAFGNLRFMGMAEGGFVKDKLPAPLLLNLSETGDLNEAAANLFAMLHQLDKTGVTSIAVMDIPNMGLGMAMNERLSRAVAWMTT